MKNLMTVSKNFVNYIIIFLIFSALIIFFILQIKIEKSIDSIMSVDEDNKVILIINSPDAYFVNNNKSVSFILDNKLYIVDNIKLIPMQNNKFSIKISDRYLELLLKPNTILKVNINLGFQKIYELFTF